MFGEGFAGKQPVDHGAQGAAYTDIDIAFVVGKQFHPVFIDQHVKHPQWDAPHGSARRWPCSAANLSRPGLGYL